MYKPEDLGLLLQRSSRVQKEAQAPWSHRMDYNEILIDGTYWVEHMPYAIDAFVGDSELAREQHQRFLNEYGLSAEQVPRLKLDPNNWFEPFSEA